MNIFSKNDYTILHTIFIPLPLKAECFRHTSLFEARVPCLKERLGDVYSQQSQTPSQSSKQCGRNALNFSKKKVREGKKITAKDMVEVVREACRTTHWKRPCAEGFYQLQTCFRYEQPGILGCRAMWSGNCFQTFRRNVPPHIQGYMSVNSLAFFGRKPQATDKWKRMGTREIDACT